MKRLRRPDVWFLPALLGAAVLGAVLLSDGANITAGENEIRHHRARHGWESAFDAFSAVCGVGLLTRDFEADLTSRGRWTLTAIGLFGAVLFLGAAAQAAQQLREAAGGPRLPSAALAVGVFLLALLPGVPLVWGVERAAGSNGGWESAAQHTAAAFASLGWLRPAPGDATAWVYAIIALAGAVGWPVWFLLIPAARRRFVQAAPLLRGVGVYVLILVVLGAVLCAFETPREMLGRGLPSENTLAGRPLPERFARSVLQAVSASTAGIPTEALASPQCSDGTRITLGGVLLVGGLGGSPGGGIKGPLFVWLLAGGAVVLGASRCRTTHMGTLRCALAGSTLVVLMLVLTLVVAGGLLLIDDRTRSPFDHPATFAEAWLDAASAVAGGNLSSGLTARVTGENLSSGGRHPVDQYQYGMAWLMFAMTLGRFLPLFVLSRMATVRIDDASRGVSPLI